MHRNAERRRLLRLPILREPLLQFMALGALIFVGFSAFGSGTAEQKARIVVDDGVIARLAALYEKQMGVAPEADQVQGLIDSHIREQVLYREALRLHLDENDEIVRRRLVQKMEFLAARSVDEPTDADLRRYYTEHRNELRQPDRVSFNHLFFSPDNGGAEKAAARAAQTLHRLRSGDSGARGAAEGDPFPLQLQYSRLARLDAVQLFGNTDIVEALFASPEGAWSGPHASGYGWHLVRIGERTGEIVPPFEQVADEVKAAYERDSTERQTQAAIQEMTSRYEIIRSAPKAAQ